uniref:Secreted protein n=1 Tax=Macrostomum lignano TaxID=282301 RepID=A0A1I8FW41_9PLAT
RHQLRHKRLQLIQQLIHQVGLGIQQREVLLLPAGVAGNEQQAGHPVQAVVRHDLGEIGRVDHGQAHRGREVDAVAAVPVVQLQQPVPPPLARIDDGPEVIEFQRSHVIRGLVEGGAGSCGARSGGPRPGGCQQQQQGSKRQQERRQ